MRHCRLQMQQFNKDTKVEGTRPHYPLHYGKMFTEGRNLAWIPVSRVMTGDYHGQLNHNIFSNWMSVKVI